MRIQFWVDALVQESNSMLTSGDDLLGQSSLFSLSFFFGGETLYFSSSNLHRIFKKFGTYEAGGYEMYTMFALPCGFAAIQCALW